ncbi:hypothetical protein GQ53DRAFT_757469 [Thozetella sp. PMI_491]|nr:hypothetical protein GQ53DRAFT_757469 [Thozetella sp. PMI_491]
MTGMEGNREQVSDFCTENLKDDAFRDWILDPCDTNVLAMFGATGCGKSTTTAFVVDYLASQSRVVCSYHFTDSDDTTDIGYVYRSLIWQLLCRKSNLKPEFLAWYMAESLTGDTDPTQSAIKLHKFLCTQPEIYAIHG